MIISFSQLIDAFDEYEFAVDNSESYENASFSGIELFVGQPIEPDILYVKGSGDLSETPKRNFLIAGKMDTGSPADMHLLGTSAIEVVNLVLRYYAHWTNCLETMREDYYERHDLSELCQTLSEYVGNPVVIYDAALLPAAQSEIDRELAINLFGSERADRDFVLDTIPDWKQEGSESVFLREGSRRISDATQRLITAACNIISNDEYQGYIEIFEVGKHISDADMLILEHAAKIISAAPSTLGEMGFIQGYLNGRVMQEGITSTWLSTLRWNANDPLYVLATYLPDKSEEAKLYLEHIARMLHLIMPNAVCQLIDGMPVVVANNRLEPIHSALVDVVSFLKKQDKGAYLGASDLLRGIEQLNIGYEHALYAARFGCESRQGILTRFEDCRFAFFKNVCNLQENESAVLDSAVKRMHEADLIAGTENTLTVKTYLECGLSLNKAAERLSIHRNTIVYRLGRVRDCYGIDLTFSGDDSGQLFQTLLSCKLLLGDT